MKPKAAEPPQTQTNILRAALGLPQIKGENPVRLRLTPPPQRNAENKTRRVQLLLRPSTWAAFSCLAHACGYSPNDYAESVLSDFVRAAAKAIDRFEETEKEESEPKN